MTAAIDAAGGDVGRAAQADVHEPLVVAQVQVGLGAVIGDEDFAVLVRVHRPRIDVEVRVQLHHRHVEPAVPQQPPQACRGDPFPNR